jgi:transposase
MKGKSKRKFTADFKLKVVLEVLKEKDTLAAISKRYELHPNQIADWKKLFMEQASQVFDRTTHLATAAETDPAPLYEQIGRLQMELSFLKKKLTP